MPEEASGAAHTGAGILAETAACVEPVVERSVPDELHLVGQTHAGEVHHGLYPIGGTPCWSLRRVQGGRSSREEVLD